jgi:hypothetical protein
MGFVLTPYTAENHPEKAKPGLATAFSVAVDPQLFNPPPLVVPPLEGELLVEMR